MPRLLVQEQLPIPREPDEPVKVALACSSCFHMHEFDLEWVQGRGGCTIGCHGCRSRVKLPFLEQMGT